MNTAWQGFLLEHGAVVESGRVTRFGDPAVELKAAQTGTILADLSHLGVLRFSGDDVQSFLHGQISSDLKTLDPAAAQYSSYCTAKGRMVAIFLVWRSEESYFLQLPAEIAEPIRKRLSLFILRAKVKSEDASDGTVRMGIAGHAAEKLLERHFLSIPSGTLGIAHGTSGTLIRLGENRFEIVTAPEQAPTLWCGLSENATPAGAPCWDWLEIRAGIPAITAATQEQFVPQMANLDAIGGVSFHKGCYPGQEIIARTQYLGRLKRRMYLVHIEAQTPPAPGDELYSPDLEGQASGVIVRAAPAPGGGYDALAVIQMASVETGEIRWKAPSGPRLQFLPLPYSV